MDAAWAGAEDATIVQEINESSDPASPRMHSEHPHTFGDIVKH